jgi:histidine decarboxylase
MPAAPAHVLERLDGLLAQCEKRTDVHLGYPYNLNVAYDDLRPFLDFFLNNLGDAYAESNYGVNTQSFEREVIDMFADMWGAPPTAKGEESEVWGAVTSCGTEGNLLGILYGREALKAVPTIPTLVSSVESHYSVAKAGRMYNMPYCRIGSNDSTGEIDYEELERNARRIVHEQNGGVCVVVNVGSTVKGAHDRLDLVLAALDGANVPPERRYIHCDAALSGLILPVVAEASDYHFGFDRGADSIAVSGHKQLGTPIPCGVVCTKREHMLRWAAGTPAEADYVNTQDSTIAGSRSGFAALVLWYVLQTKGLSGLESDARYCMDSAEYLKNELLRKVPDCNATRSEFSTTVVFQRPSEEVEMKYQLATTGEIAHIVCTPSVDKRVLDAFTNEYANEFKLL